MEAKVEGKKEGRDELKQFISIVLRYKVTIGVCLLLGLLGSILYLYVLVKPAYQVSALIDTGYITDNDGKRQRFASVEELAQEIKDVFIESKKIVEEDAEKPRMRVTEVELVADSSGRGKLPYLRIEAQGKEREDAQKIANDVLAYIQEKNRLILQRHVKRIQDTITIINARIKSIKEVQIPYIDSKILQTDADIKESASLSQTQTLTTYLNQLQASLDGLQNQRTKLENETLLALEQDRLRHEAMLSEGAVQDAFFVPKANVDTKPTIKARKWLVFLLGLFSGGVVAGVIVFSREIISQIKKEGLD
ncbi:hypothetical protein CQA49_03555 [Helicobacter sp. MIT 00-7814]|uniref:hypothetical protein n=1 Tax=unclassified Helicobacter TaxID=2593540 RepID=UPI000E1EA260|nr:MULTISPECIES: hypothetical protein [unclassified Helicobacter]RDU55548.1 hypothetical protein CQA37_03975 [Helicobacter sp. MIT 99-10781]RDU55638.1 hypothetical protein CQA49_03555 [Helicobacter sp. MIT 00-7814]